MDIFTFGTGGGIRLGAATYGQLTNFNFDCVTVGVSTESFLVGMCKKLARDVVLSGNYERAYRGDYRYDLGVDWKWTDSISLGIITLRRPAEHEGEEALSSVRFQFRFRFVIQ